MFVDRFVRFIHHPNFGNNQRHIFRGTDQYDRITRIIRKNADPLGLDFVVEHRIDQFLHLWQHRFRIGIVQSHKARVWLDGSVIKLSDQIFDGADIVGVIGHNNRVAFIGEGDLSVSTKKKIDLTQNRTHVQVAHWDDDGLHLRNRGLSVSRRCGFGSIGTFDHLQIAVSGIIDRIPFGREHFDQQIVDLLFGNRFDGDKIDRSLHILTDQNIFVGNTRYHFDKVDNFEIFEIQFHPFFGAIHFCSGRDRTQHRRGQHDTDENLSHILP